MSVPEVRGRTTGFTTGSINAVNVDVDVCYFPLTETICFPGYEAHYVNQFSVTTGPSFSAPGDSGSLIVTQGWNQPVGLLFAGGDGLTIANPDRPGSAAVRRHDRGHAAGVARPAPPPASTPPPATGTAPLLDGTELRRRLPDHRLHRVSRDEPEPDDVFTTLGSDVLHRLGRFTNGDDLLLQGVRGQRGTARARARTRRPRPRPALVGPPSRYRLDGFNRGYENPLSDAGRWTNGSTARARAGL